LAVGSFGNLNFNVIIIIDFDSQSLGITDLIDYSIHLQYAQLQCCSAGPPAGQQSSRLGSRG